jgi:hypothetical protein
VKAEILTIVGSFVSIGLGLNAYFIKQLVDSIQEVKIDLATIFNESKHLERRINTSENNIVHIFDRLHKIETKDKK